MKLPLMAGGAVFVAQAVASGGGYLSQDKITELLLAGLVALATFIVRDVNRSSVALFGPRNDDKDGGIVGDIKKVKEWQEEMDRKIDRGEIVSGPGRILPHRDRH